MNNRQRAYAIGSIMFAVLMMFVVASASQAPLAAAGRIRIKRGGETIQIIPQHGLRGKNIPVYDKVVDPVDEESPAIDESKTNVSAECLTATDIVGDVTRVMAQTLPQSSRAHVRARAALSQAMDEAIDKYCTK